MGGWKGREGGREGRGRDRAGKSKIFNLAVTIMTSIEPGSLSTLASLSIAFTPECWRRRQRAAPVEETTHLWQMNTHDSTSRPSSIQIVARGGDAEEPSKK